jgi:hypothetical protein
MHATIRRYDGVDQNRAGELSRKVNESFAPKISEMPGFRGYYLIEADNGVLSSISLFETAQYAADSDRFAASWVRDERLETALPNPPKIITGNVVAEKIAVAVA